jgi:hypothetical protein
MVGSPVSIEMVTRRVQTRLERQRTGPEEWLVVTRCPLADEGTVAGQAWPDVRDQMLAIVIATI